MKKSLIVGAILMACSAFAAPVLEYDFSTGKMFPAKPVLVGNPEIKDGALVLDAEKKQYLELPKELDLSAAKDVTFYTVLRFGEDGSMKKDASGKNTVPPPIPGQIRFCPTAIWACPAYAPWTAGTARPAPASAPPGPSRPARKAAPSSTWGAACSAAPAAMSAPRKP